MTSVKFELQTSFMQEQLPNPHLPLGVVCTSLAIEVSAATPNSLLSMEHILKLRKAKFVSIYRQMKDIDKMKLFVGIMISFRKIYAITHNAVLMNLKSPNLKPTVFW